MHIQLLRKIHPFTSPSSRIHSVRFLCEGCVRQFYAHCVDTVYCASGMGYCWAPSAPGEGIAGIGLAG